MGTRRQIDHISKEESFELERQSKIDVEGALNSQIQHLQQELRAVQSKLERQTPPTPPPRLEDDFLESSESTEEPSFVAQVAMVSQLRAELADMSESQLSLTEMHTALQLQVHNLEHEVAERTAECYRLREENEGFEILLRERTLDGRVYDADVFGNMSDDDVSETDVSEASSSARRSAFRKERSIAQLRRASLDRADSSRSKRKTQAQNLADDLGDSAVSWYPQSKSSPINEQHPVNTNDRDVDGKVDHAIGTTGDLSIFRRFLMAG